MCGWSALTQRYMYQRAESGGDLGQLEHQTQEENGECDAYKEEQRDLNLRCGAISHESWEKKKGLSGETCQIKFNMTDELYPGQWRHQACVRSPPAHIRSVVN